jgi:hypothetical protein
MVYAQGVSESSFLNPPPAEREMLAFVSTLPKDALFAGSPCAIDNIPLFSKRRTLFDCERFTQPWIMRDALYAYYAADGATVGRFCRQYQVDYLVADSRTYTAEFLEAGQFFFEPYNQALLERIQGQSDFVLADLPADKIIFQAEYLTVVPCETFYEE